MMGARGIMTLALALAILALPVTPAWAQGKSVV